MPLLLFVVCELATVRSELCSLSDEVRVSSEVEHEFCLLSDHVEVSSEVEQVIMTMSLRL